MNTTLILVAIIIVLLAALIYFYNFSQNVSIAIADIAGTQLDWYSNYPSEFNEFLNTSIELPINDKRTDYVIIRPMAQKNKVNIQFRVETSIITASGGAFESNLTHQYEFDLEKISTGWQLKNTGKVIKSGPLELVNRKNNVLRLYEMPNGWNLQESKPNLGSLDTYRNVKINPLISEYP